MPGRPDRGIGTMGLFEGTVAQGGMVEHQAGAQTARGLGLVPMVIEQSGRGERAYDIYSGC